MTAPHVVHRLDRSLHQGEFVASCPGSCGELVQGQLDGVDFLVTCPIDLFARAEFAPAAAGGERLQGAGWKTMAAVRSFLKRAGYTGGWQVTVSSAVPVGKGMASSTADITAALGAATLFLCEAFWSPGLDRWRSAHGMIPEEFPDAPAGCAYVPASIAGTALAVEPTDGLMFPGIVLFDHRRGIWLEPLGEPPPLEVLVFDQGGHVETISFNQRADFQEQNRAKSELVARALELVRDGLQRKDPLAIGAGATLSALANQTMLPKEGLEVILQLSKEVGALGVNVAHSGSVFGLLLDPRRQDGPDLASYLAHRIPGRFLGRYGVIGGGIRWPAGIDHQEGSGRS
ncbi:MAG: GHMP kinase [Firmicutes bacterium]|nr:GHMP kinase [Bacillota bacterium]